MNSLEEYAFVFVPSLIPCSLTLPGLFDFQLSQLGVVSVFCFVFHVSQRVVIKKMGGK